MATFRIRRWVAYVTVAEGIGFLAPTAAFALTAVSEAGTWVAYACLVLAGAVEGACLGFGQARALRGVLTARDQRLWVLATAAAAAVAWMIGMVPSTLVDLGVGVDMGDPLVLGMAAGAGTVLLATIPSAQWPVLRRVTPVAWRWIPLNMGAWLAGGVFTLLPSPFIDQTTPGAVLALAYALAGVAMALTVATLTGLGLRQLLAAGRD